MKSNTIQYHSDESILLALKQYDESAMELLHRKYSKVLFKKIYSIVKKQETCEEVLQDVFTKVWCNIDAFDLGRGKLFTWLMNIAQNAAIDATRSRFYSQQKRTIENTSITVDSYHRVTFDTDNFDLKYIVKELNPELKTVVEMIYFEGYTQKEVSEILILPIGTVKTRVRKAVDRLRSYYNKK